MHRFVFSRANQALVANFSSSAKYGRYLSSVSVIRPPNGQFEYRITKSATTMVPSLVLRSSESYLPLLSSFGQFHTHTPLCKDPESKAEKTANLLKENIITAKKEPTAASAAPLADVTVKPAVAASVDEKKEEIKTAITTSPTTTVAPIAPPAEKAVDVIRPSLWQRVVKELKHYYHGFKLLYFETKIMFRLLRRVLQGHTLTRRERRQFTRTAADLFRLVPFSVFIIVPFMEFTLPIFLKLFPNMLPSTFQEESTEQDKLKKRLKAKLEMAKFLQDTLEETALKADKNNVDSSLNTKFAEFMKKVRSKGQQPSNEEIMKYSSLFENELTLDNLTRQQLIALCQILDVSTLANIPPNNILRFQLRMKIRTLEADDKVIIKEGIENLDIGELQQACRDRGMRAIGVSEDRLKHQLEQWLDLHINRKIPLSLLILSRALYLPENLPPEDIIKSTISVLPKSIEDATLAKITEVSGAKVDNKVKLELLKQEEAEIKLESIASSEAAAIDEKKAAAAAAAVESPVPAMKPAEVLKPIAPEPDFGAAQLAKETLVDKAKVLSDKVKVEAQEMLSPKEIKEINQIIENLPSSEKIQVRAEIEELKKDVDEYKEDVKEVEELTAVQNATKLTETKSAKILSKRVQKLINDMDKLVAKIDKEVPTAESQVSNKNTVSIVELLGAIKKIRGTPDVEKDNKLIQVLETLDKDHDGKIDDLSDVLKVFDLIEQENVKVSKNQLRKLLTLLEKEKLIEIEEQKEEIKQKSESSQAKPTSS